MIFCAKWQNFGSGLSGLGIIGENLGTVGIGENKAGKRNF